MQHARPRYTRWRLQSPRNLSLNSNSARPEETVSPITAGRLASSNDTSSGERYTKLFVSSGMAVYGVHVPHLAPGRLGIVRNDLGKQ